jgi:hypothetical protein
VDISQDPGRAAGHGAGGTGGQINGRRQRQERKTQPCPGAVAGDAVDGRWKTEGEGRDTGGHCQIRMKDRGSSCPPLHSAIPFPSFLEDNSISHSYSVGRGICCACRSRHFGGKIPNSFLPAFRSQPGQWRMAADQSFSALPSGLAWPVLISSSLRAHFTVAEC